LINVRTFLEEWSQILCTEDVISASETAFENYVCGEMNVTQEMTEELEVVCGVGTLQCSKEPTNMGRDARRDMLKLKEMPVGVNLVTVEMLKNDLMKRKHDKVYGSKVKEWLKHMESSEAWVHSVKKADSSDQPKDGTLEALLTVRVYKPFHHRSKLMPLKEIQVLGSQCLTELRDAISCSADMLVPGEFSDNPDLPQDIRAKDLYKSGFFYIEGVFYNDMRDTSSHEISQIIVEWAKDPSRGVGPFASEKMEDFRFVDLTIRLGLPYVYVHQGDCEHLLIFTEIRLLHPEDCWDARQYPLKTSSFLVKRKQCCVCISSVAQWLVRRSELAITDPAFFCDTCFRMLHYAKDKSKLLDFDAYPLHNK